MVVSCPPAPPAGDVYGLLTGTLPPTHLASLAPTLRPPLTWRGSASRSASSITDTWAVLLNTSRFWFNYRHSANILLLYQALRARGVPDSNIIVMNADDHACSPRNSYPCTLISEPLSETHPGRYHPDTGRFTTIPPSAQDNLYRDVEVDYFGDEVTPQTFYDVLLGRSREGTASHRVLASSPTSQVLVYVTGHSHADFIRFQDRDAVTSTDIGDLLKEMHRQGRYRDLLWIADTCEVGVVGRHGSDACFFLFSFCSHPPFR